MDDIFGILHNYVEEKPKEEKDNEKIEEKSNEQIELKQIELEPSTFENHTKTVKFSEIFEQSRKDFSYIQPQKAQTKKNATYFSKTEINKSKNKKKETLDPKELDLAKQELRRLKDRQAYLTMGKKKPLNMLGLRISNDIIFDDYLLNQVHIAQTKITNTSESSSRIRILPPNHPDFLLAEVIYPSNSSIIAPGMSVTLVIHFIPKNYSPQQSSIFIHTSDDYSIEIPIIAKKFVPKLTIPANIDLGSVFLNTTNEYSFVFENFEGKNTKFALIDEEMMIETHENLEKAQKLNIAWFDREKSLGFSPFFYDVNTNEECQVNIVFNAKRLGKYEKDLRIVLDNGSVGTTHIQANVIQPAVLVDFDLSKLEKLFPFIEYELPLRIINTNDELPLDCTIKVETSTEEIDFKWPIDDIQLNKTNPEETFILRFEGRCLGIKDLKITILNKETNEILSINHFDFDFLKPSMEIKECAKIFEGIIAHKETTGVIEIEMKDKAVIPYEVDIIGLNGYENLDKYVQYSFRPVSKGGKFTEGLNYIRFVLKPLQIGNFSIFLKLSTEFIDEPIYIPLLLTIEPLPIQCSIGCIDFGVIKANTKESIEFTLKLPFIAHDIQPIFEIQGTMNHCFILDYDYPNTSTINSSNITNSSKQSIVLDYPCRLTLEAPFEDIKLDNFLIVYYLTSKLVLQIRSLVCIPKLVLDPGYLDVILYNQHETYVSTMISMLTATSGEFYFDLPELNDDLSIKIIPEKFELSPQNNQIAVTFVLKPKRFFEGILGFELCSKDTVFSKPIGLVISMDVVKVSALITMMKPLDSTSRPVSRSSVLTDDDRLKSASFKEDLGESIDQIIATDLQIGEEYKTVLKVRNLAPLPALMVASINRFGPLPVLRESIMSSELSLRSSRRVVQAKPIRFAEVGINPSTVNISDHGTKEIDVTLKGFFPGVYHDVISVVIGDSDPIDIQIQFNVVGSPIQLNKTLGFDLIKNKLVYPTVNAGSKVLTRQLSICNISPLTLRVDPNIIIKPESLPAIESEITVLENGKVSFSAKPYEYKGHDSLFHVNGSVELEPYAKALIPIQFDPKNDANQNIDECCQIQINPINQPPLGLELTKISPLNIDLISNVSVPRLEMDFRKELRMFIPYQGNKERNEVIKPLILTNPCSFPLDFQIIMFEPFDIIGIDTSYTSILPDEDDGIISLKPGEAVKLSISANLKNIQNRLNFNLAKQRFHEQMKIVFADNSVQLFDLFLYVHYPRAQLIHNVIDFGTLHLHDTIKKPFELRNISTCKIFWNVTSKNSKFFELFQFSSIDGVLEPLQLFTKPSFAGKAAPAFISSDINFKRDPGAAVITFSANQTGLIEMEGEVIVKNGLNIPFTLVGNVI
eukprot:TRINITY_DN1630_c0_g1_i1.p1 TRINITY_DN1630_c0_g1~~TRINITY_DN1630_c0_g1_i1.p1  ORF type:complete len:1384 (+),score=431.33 TRINITY_DN1630_c0_g1_i1:39-4154(+)